MADTSIESMMRVVVGLDGSRRAGWAQMYAQKDKVDSLSRDVNVLRSEREIMRRSASYFYGFIYQMSRDTGSIRARDDLRKMVSGLDAVLDENVILEGKRAGQLFFRSHSDLRRWKPKYSSLISYAEGHQQRLFFELRGEFFGSLSRRYGFSSRKRFVAFLDCVLAHHAIDDPELDALIEKCYLSLSEDYASTMRDPSMLSIKEKARLDAICGNEKAK